MLRPFALAGSAALACGLSLALLPLTALPLRAADGEAGGTAPAASTAPAAATTADRLAGLLGLDPLLGVLQKEGADYGASLEDEMFAGEGGTVWTDTVTRIYAPERTAPIFRTAFDAALDGTDTAAMEAFFAGDLGRRAVELELAAREALLDDGVEEAARHRVEELVADDSPRLKALADFVAAGDLVEANVEGGLNANLAFYRGLTQGGAFPPGMAAEDMLSDVWGQEDQIRQETGDWLYAYLAMAYDPMSDADLAAYTAFSASPAGQELNRALFAGYDAVFEDVSFQLGLAATHYLKGEDI